MKDFDYERFSTKPSKLKQVKPEHAEAKKLDDDLHVIEQSYTELHDEFNQVDTTKDQVPTLEELEKMTLVTHTWFNADRTEYVRIDPKTRAVYKYVCENGTLIPYTIEKF